MSRDPWMAYFSVFGFTDRIIPLKNTHFCFKSRATLIHLILLHMVTSSLQMTTHVDGTMIEGTTTEGTQTEGTRTEGTIGRIATIRGQGTN